MKEYEIVAKYCNACGGTSHPQTSFEEAELESIDDYVRMKHSKDFDKFTKETLAIQSILDLMKVRATLLRALTYSLS